MSAPLPLASRRAATAALLCALAGACHRDHGSSSGPDALRLEVDFALRTDLVLGSAFLGDVVPGDLDGDGLTDLVESNFGTRFVTIAFGLADGRFRSVYELPTPGHAFQLALADLDANGLLDVAVTNGAWTDGAPEGVQVFLQGPAPREFGPSLWLPLAGGPKGLVALPADGLAASVAADELYVALRDAGRVQRLALESGALVAREALDAAPLADFTPYSLAVLDLGADGTLDLLVGEDTGAADRLIELRRAGAGFAPATALLGDLRQPVVEASGDFDGNGHEDLAIAQLGSDEVRLLPGVPAGLAAGVALDPGGVTTSFLAADLDGDGLSELVATLFEQQSLQVRRGLAPFVWDEPVHYNVGTAPRALAVVNVPGDSHADLLCANAQDLSLLLGRGDASFRGATGVATGAERPIYVATADLDNDGDEDAVAITRFQASLVFLENVDGLLQPAGELPVAPSAKEDAYLTLADADQDGDVDVLVAAYGTDELLVFRNQGGPARFSAPDAGDRAVIGDGPFGLDAGDFDGNGMTDLAVGLADGHALAVLLGVAGGGFQALAPQALPFEPVNLLCADFDNDGNADLALTGRTPSGNLLAILAGDGAGGFTLASSFELEARAAGLALGDLDEDGALDLVVGSFELAEDSMTALLNLGGLQFQAERVALAGGPGTPLAADADQDGHLDVVALTTGGELYFARGNGAGSFASARLPGSSPAPEGTLSAALADLDGDRLPELLMVTPEAPFVWIAHNTSTEAVRE